MLHIKNILKTTLIVCIAFLTLESCKKKKNDPEPPANEIPSTFNFENVSYGGQVIRLLLLMDLETKMQEAKTSSISSTELRNIFDLNNEVLGRHTSFGTGKSLKGSFFSSTANSALKTTMVDSIYSWLDSIAVRSGNANALVRNDGVDLSQAVAKTIMGGVFFDQAVNKYLVNLLTADNQTITPGSGTAMEHAFDEAFGYFGAARDYNNYTDLQIKDGYHIDSDGNGKKDTLYEMNFKYYASTAAKRDLTSAGFSSGKTDYTKNLFDAFLKGRFGITNNDFTKRDEAISDIKKYWEEMIAATVLHYINATKADIASSSPDLNKHWSEMKFYFNMIAIYPSNKLGNTSILTINTQIGNKPSDTNATLLNQAAETIRAAYGFNTEQRDNFKKAY